MSFLSRRPSRSGNRGSDAGRDAEYDDYDYAPDGYARGDEDDSWSANEYFSPEGIKGRRAAGREPGDRQPGDRQPGRYEDSLDGGGYEGAGYNGYQGGEYAAGGTGGTGGTGAYDLPDGTDEDRGERGGRRRKDRGERGGLLRLRRDKGEDIWPDDGVSDEDYWASVAADRPLPPANSPLDSGPSTAAGDPRLIDEARPVPGTRTGADQRGADQRGADQRGADPRYGGEPRGGSGRLGPAPGLVGDYSPAPPPAAASALRRSAPQRTATGPHALRPDRPGTGSGQSPRNSGGLPRSSGGFPRSSGGFPRTDASPPAPSFSPNARQQDRPDWGEATERMDRVTATGYPDPRVNSRGPGPAAGGPAAAGRGRADSGSWRTADRGERSHDAGPAQGRNSGAWPAAGRNSAHAPARAAGHAAGHEDPLTSAAYSRFALSDADGRSYRAAARRSQAQAKLTEETQTFSAPVSYPGDRYPSGGYPSSQRPAGRSQAGEHPDTYRAGQPRPDAQEPTVRYPAYGSQQPGQAPQPGQAARHGQAPGRPGQPGGNSGRVSLPGTSGGASGPYPAQQPRQPQAQQPQQAQQSPQPAGGNPYDSAVTGSYPYPGQTGYPARAGQQPQAPGAPGGPGGADPNARDDRRRRQAPPDGYRDGRY